MGRRGRNNKKAALMERVWRIAIYIRLSKDDGNDESKSIGHQRQMILDYLKAFDEPYEIYEIFIDDGYSGANSDREGFQNMLTAIYRYQVNCVIVKDLSRLARNVADSTFHIENTFVEYDIRFISLELPQLDSYKNPEGMNSIAVGIQNVFNEDFCKQTSIKVKGVLNNRRRNGLFVGAFAPYGYRKDPEDHHRLLVDSEAAAVVRDVFQWYVRDGMSKGSIARKLNERGVLNPTAYKKSMGSKYHSPTTAKNDGYWSPSSVTMILENQMYIGDMVQGRYYIKSYKVQIQVSKPKEEWVIVEGTHEAIIEKDVFFKAAERMKKDTRIAPGKATIYPLGGYLRCADCGKAMVRTKSGGKKGYAYYKCRTHREKGVQFCSAHTIRADKLEAAVLAAVKAQVLLIPDLQRSIEQGSKDATVQYESLRLRRLQEQREKDLKRATVTKDGLFKDWKNGDITREEYRQYKDELLTEIERLKDVVSNLECELTNMKACPQNNAPSIDRYIKMQTLDRSLIVDLIDSIIVMEGGRIKINFAYADQHKEVHPDGAVGHINKSRGMTDNGPMQPTPSSCTYPVGAEPSGSPALFLYGLFSVKRRLIMVPLGWAPNYWKCPPQAPQPPRRCYYS